MTGLVRKATLFAVCGLLAANAAMASTPSAANSTVPGNVNIVGYSTNPNPGANGATRFGTNGTFFIDGVDGPITVNIRDINNLPVNNALVIFDFSACSGLQLCSDQMQAGITVTCAGPGANTVRGFTDINGDLTLSVGGHANNGFTGVFSGDTDPNNGLACAGCMTITAGGVDMTPGGPIAVGSYDEDGNGVSPPDQAAFMGDQFGVLSGFVGRNPDRSDFDATCVVGPADQSLYMQVLFGTLFANVPLSSTNCGTDAVPNVDIGHCPVIP